jgi:hypothetical protein
MGPERQWRRAPSTTAARAPRSDTFDHWGGVPATARSAMTSSERPTLTGDPFSFATEPPPETLPPPEPSLALESVPWVVASFAELQRLPLDHRSGFILSLIDGRANITTIIDMSAMPRDEVIAILDELVLRRVIEMHGAA